MTAEVVYLSPHLDDAALSCGGQIAQRARSGERVIVLTVLAGYEPTDSLSPLARQLHHAFRLPAGGVVAARRAEDQRSAALLGAIAIHWEITEAAYRQRPDGDPLYSSVEQLFAPPPPEEDALVDLLAARLEEHSTARHVVAPLAVGGHVDHLLVRRAAEKAFPGRLLYFEDYPYAERHGALQRALGGDRWQQRIVRLSSQDLQQKIAAIEAFRSQIRPLFRGRWRFRRRLRAYHRKVGGERLWNRY